MGALVRFYYPCVILDPLFALKITMEKANMNFGSCVCDNDSMSIFRECPSNELIELLKSKKHVRIFLHMLKCLKRRNHMLHNSLCKSNSLIENIREGIDTCVISLINSKEKSTHRMIVKG